MKLMRSACHKKGSAVTPAKTRNTRNSKKEATGSEMQIFGLARVKSSQSKSSDELCATSVQHRAVASLGTRPVNRSKRTSIVQYAGSASVAKW